ncbi:MAG: hypothetical protein KAQ64_02300 [Candidatus Pacebacteria bacterium]|nr:hypothetical protein [Candidatus Paceibacterota bacterium]
MSSIRISILNPDGTENKEKTEMLANMLKEQRLQFELSRELVAETVVKTANHFKDPGDKIEISCPGIISTSDEALSYEPTAEHKMIIFTVD